MFHCLMLHRMDVFCHCLASRDMFPMVWHAIKVDFDALCGHLGLVGEIQYFDVDVELAMEVDETTKPDKRSTRQRKCGVGVWDLVGKLENSMPRHMLSSGEMQVNRTQP